LRRYRRKPPTPPRATVEKRAADCVAARSDGVAEDGESRKICGSGEECEVMSYAKSSAYAGPAAAVFSAHHVSELPLDLWSRSAIAPFPVGIALTFSLAVEDDHIGQRGITYRHHLARGGCMVFVESERWACFLASTDRNALPSHDPAHLACSMHAIMIRGGHGKGERDRGGV